MATNLHKNKIIWAVDPTQKPANASKIITELRYWAAHLNCDIQPVAVFSDQLLKLPIELSYPWKEKFSEVTQKLIDQFIKKTRTEDFLPAEKLFITSNSTRKMAAELAKYAEKNKALMIFANTRAKKAWNVFRLGGFSEALVSVAKTPVLLLNPEAKPSYKIPRILFPTDFGQGSERALKTLIPWGRAFNSKIILYNQLETLPIYASTTYDYLPLQTISLKSMMTDIALVRREKADKWQNLLKNQNIQSDFILQREKKSLSSDILDAAKKKGVNLIALASEAGPFTQVVLGSVAKDVLLHAKTPVLIFHYEQQAKVSVRPDRHRKQRPESRPSAH